MENTRLGDPGPKFLHSVLSARFTKLEATVTDNLFSQSRRDYPTGCGVLMDTGGKTVCDEATGPVVRTESRATVKRFSIFGFCTLLHAHGAGECVRMAPLNSAWN